MNNTMQNEIVVSISGDGDCTSISDAYKQVAPGGTITIRPGAYLCELTINKSITIRGLEGSNNVILHSKRKKCIEIETPGNVRLEGLTIQCLAEFQNEIKYRNLAPNELVSAVEHDVDEENRLFAIHIKRGNVIITGCSVSSSNYGGVLAEERSDVTCSNVTVINSRIVGIVIADKTTFNMLDSDVSGHIIGIIMENAELSMKGCNVGHNKIMAISSTDASMNIERTTIRDNAMGIYLTRGAKINIKNSKVFNHDNLGIMLSENSNGNIEECVLYRNQAGIGACEGSNPIVKKCKIYDCTQFGAGSIRNGQGMFYDTEIWNSPRCFEIADGSNPIISRCHFHDASEGPGVIVCDNGRGTIEDSIIDENTGSGIGLFRGGCATIRACKIVNNHGYGIRVLEKGGATISNCDLTNNRDGAYDIGLYENMFTVEKKNNHE
jgi:parallel beta-helix repeat protein